MQIGPSMKNKLWLSILIFAGAIFRFYHLGTPSLWLDEIGQVVAALSPVSMLLERVGNHLSPPLDYLILKSFLFFGHSDWLVRLPACLYGIASIPVMFFFARRLAGEKTALLASAFLAFSPMAIAYSQEARMYSLFLFLALASYLFFLRILANSDRRDVLLLGLVNGLMLLTHYFAFFLVGMEIVLMAAYLFFSQTFRKNITWLILGFVLSFLIFAPWLPSLLSQIKHSGGQIGYALPLTKDYFKFIFNGFSIHTGGEEGFWYYLLIVLSLAGLVISSVKKEMRLVIAAATFILSILGFYLLLDIVKVVTTRNMIYLLPLYLVLCARGLSGLLETVKLDERVGVILLALILLPPVYQYHFKGRPDFKPDWKSAAQYIRQHINAGEKVIVPDVISRGSLAFYLEPESESVYTKSLTGQAENAAAWLVWSANDKLDAQIKNGVIHGWFVLPPNLFGVADGAKVIEETGLAAQKPEKEFSTQGKGKPLAIYHF
jgi:uncharacterized membrane protein